MTRAFLKIHLQPVCGAKPQKAIFKTWPVWTGKFPCCRRQMGFIMPQPMMRVALEKQF
jgi:hypothetical protein